MFYHSYRIDANMAIEYIDMNDKTYVIPVSSIRNILFHENENYIQRLGFEEMPGYHRFGPFWVKDKNLKEQVEA